MGANKSKPKLKPKLKSKSKSKLKGQYINYHEIITDNVQPIIDLNININNVDIRHVHFFHHMTKKSLLEIISEKYLPKITKYILENSIKINEEAIKKIIMSYDIDIINLLETNYNLNLINYTSVALQFNQHVDVNAHFINMNPVIDKSFFEDILTKLSRYNDIDINKASYMISLIILKGHVISLNNFNDIISMQLEESLSILSKHKTAIESAKIYVHDHTCQICQKRYIDSSSKKCKWCKN